MAYIKDDVLNEIRARANIVDIISDYLPVKQHGRNFFAQCPFHGNGNERTPSLSISPERQIFNCFACGTGGNVFSFVMKIEDVTFIEAVGIVAKKVGYNLKIDSSTSLYQEKYQEDIDIMEFAKKYYLNNIWTNEGIKAREYLAKRGIDEAIIKEFNIGYATKEKDTLYKLLTKKNYNLQKLDDLGLVNKSGLDVYDTFTNRIMIPIENLKGQVVGFTGRIFNGEDAAKYMNTKETPIFKKGSILFNYHNAREYIKEHHQIIIVEGNMDAIKLSSSGIKNVVALQGVAITPEHIEVLRKLNVPIVLMLDNDTAGLDATVKNGELLQNSGLEVSVVRLSDAKDPDEYIRLKGVEALKDNIKNALKYIDFKLEYLKTNKNMNNIDDISLYVKEVLASLNNQDDLTKSLIISKISKDYQIDQSILLKNISLDNKQVKKEVKEEKKVIKANKYHIAVSKIIYYMLMDSEYITKYQNRLGYFKEKIERVIASEIIYYYNQHHDINIADFTTYIMPKEEESRYVLNVIQENETTDLNEKEFDACIAVILDILKKDEIEKLKEQIKKELDVNKKVELIARLTEIKKDV